MNNNNSGKEQSENWQIETGTTEKGKITKKKSDLKEKTTGNEHLEKENVE